MRYVLIIFAVLAAAAVLLFWGRPSPTVTVPINIPAPPVAGTPNAENTGPTAGEPANPLFARKVIVRPRAAAGPETNAPTEWEVRIAEALTADVTDAEMSARLLELYPGLPPEGQAELAPHLVAVLPDTDYARVETILTNITTPEAVLEVLLTDLMGRPAATRMNTLLTVARNAEHPRAEDARDMLVALTGQDFGQDWTQWAKKISEWLASHPE